MAKHAGPRCGTFVELTALDKADRKVVINFGKFLRGKGKRCPTCLHKGRYHLNPWLNDTRGCTKCSCQISGNRILSWYRAGGLNNVESSRGRARE